MYKKRILVAPLNWGLGHATRCIPVIRALIEQNFVPVIASDGDALQLLKKEFPELEHYSLPSYAIEYSKHPFLLKFKLLGNTPHIFKTISKELKHTEDLIKNKNISGIISDNRWGVRSRLVPSVFITHQILVLSGLTTLLSSRIQQAYINKFDECWVPDLPGTINLSGKMSHLKKTAIPVKYLGILSRFEKEERLIEYDILVLLSGPEPQRSILEKIMFKELKDMKAKIYMVRGVVEEFQKVEKKGNFTVCNFMTSRELEGVINSSKLVISRSGYTTLMDLAKLEKPCFLIPTPGQPEQEYLSNRLKKMGISPGCPQSKFTAEKLQEVKDYSELSFFSSLPGFLGSDDFSRIFALFKGE
ncbi:glycosyltransferase [Gillisia sp. Q332]|uniref:glycosyltransferase n=1 Tax=Gillisia xinjiangensis TaxID=3384765 RepID=UPI00391B9A40